MQIELEENGRDLCIGPENDFEESVLRDFGRDVEIIPTFSEIEKKHVCGYIIRRKAKE